MSTDAATLLKDLRAAWAEHGDDLLRACSMTLLVLDVHIPGAGLVHSERDLALGALGPQWIAYGMSFLTLGIFWAGQQRNL